MYKVYIDGMLMPIAPATIETKINNKNKTVELINEGEVNILKSPGLTDISVKFLLPNVKYPFANGSQNAKYYLDKIESLKVNKVPFQFIVTRLLPNGRYLHATNIKVSIEDYNITDDAGEIFDQILSTSMKQYKPYGTVKAKIKGPWTYTVKKGDTLRKIAKKYLGKSSRYKEIKALNKKVIKKNGGKIKKGMKLKIPAV